MMAESSGLNPDLLTQFVMNLQGGKQGVVYVLTEVTTLKLSVSPFFFFLFHSNGKGLSNISKPMTQELKYKTAMFSGINMMLCLYSTHFCLFDFSIISGKYTVHIYFHR
jgi:hypothetical protein